jgi:NAD-dependent protein deacetylase/lipoamidase
MAAVEPIDMARYRRTVVLTGAGISAASGLPTYRGTGGLWTPENVERYATAQAVSSDPRGVWEFFARTRVAFAPAEPNRAHRALAALEARLGPEHSLTVLTQNVDGLHALAGSQRVVELHGTLRKSRCTSCDYVRAENLAECPPDCPVCPQCSAPLRPAIVLFDEFLSAETERAAKEALRRCDLFLAVGTAGAVAPAANFVRSARFEGARTIYVNVQPMTPPNPAFGEALLGPAEEVLPELFGVSV